MSLRQPFVMRVALVALIAALAVTGCSNDSNGETTESILSESSSGGGVLSGTSWRLDYYLANQDAVTAVPDPPATLTFAPGGALSGSTGCNTFEGSYTTAGTALTITLGPLPQQQCATAAATAQQTAVTQMLPTTASYLIAGESLSLSAADSSKLLRYSSASPTLGGTSWNVTAVGAGGLVPLRPSDPKLTAIFGADGNFSGFGGCSQLTGPYISDNSKVVLIGPVTAGPETCAGDASQLQGKYLVALGKVSTYSTAGDTVTFRDIGAAVVITATAAH